MTRPGRKNQQGLFSRQLGSGLFIGLLPATTISVPSLRLQVRGHVLQSQLKLVITNCPILRFIRWCTLFYFIFLSFLSSFSYTVVFHSIRQGPWHVTTQPKFWFQHSEFGRDKARNSAVQRCRPQKFTMLRLWSPNGFGTGKNCPLQPLHFGNFEGHVTHYCQIEWNSTVLPLYTSSEKRIA